MANATSCLRFLCAPLDPQPELDDLGFAVDWRPLEIHHEACPLWPGIPPAPGERLELGRHRLPLAQAEDAPAWPPLGALARAAAASYRRWLKGGARDRERGAH